MPFNYRLLARQLAASLFPRGRPALRIGSRRARFLGVFAVAFPLMWLTSVLGMCLDNLFYRGWRLAARRFPVFIVGNFRTGSTFLLRLLAGDRRSFTSTETWELYFAPSVIQRRFWRGFWTVDRFFGSPLRNAMKSRQERVFGDVRLHRIRLQEPEEDEALFLYTWHTLFTCFFFPMSDPGLVYHRFDTALPRATRRRLLSFYEGCIGRHVYAHGSSAHYLAKSPSATSRIASILERYPEARFIYLYRDPLETIPSTMRWFSFAWHYFSSARERYPLKELILEFAMQWYRYPLELAETEAGRSILFVSYEDLVADPEETVRRIYGWLGFPLSDEFAALLRKEAEAARGYRPDGTGDLTGTGLTEEEILGRFGEVAAACRTAVEASRRLTSPGVPRRKPPRPSALGSRGP